LQGLVRGKKKTLLLYSAILTRKKPQVGSVFPTIAYDLSGRGNRFRIITDLVDSITKPACVIPVTVNSADYINFSKRLEMRFYSIPFEFLFRNDWGSTDIDLAAEIKRTIKNSDSSKLYEIETNRHKMMTSIIQCIKANGENNDGLADEDIINNAVLVNR
jgi:hypothetical protein